MKRALSKINIPKAICYKLIGKHHKPGHRMIVGAAFMFSGVMVAHSGFFFQMILIQASLDMVGYGIHALGSVPFLEWLLEDPSDTDGKTTSKSSQHKGD